MILAFPLFVLELILSIRTGMLIGFGNSILWIISSMLLGLILLKQSHKALLVNINTLSGGQFSLKSFGDASISYLAASVLLIIPGVLSDTLGVILLIYTIYLHLVAKMQPEIKNNNFDNSYNEDIIDVEVMDSNDVKIEKDFIK
ncbi:Putative integral memnbrane protein [hydrothermal vent metagenome]|uniref:Putative integral memnbrane protein n=1 Tax=hydrothermal vent metagenome TaxID=652676 RepID=A0A1W1EKF7_9ZZZZ